MKKLLIILALVIAQPLWAGCESSIIEGSHTDLKKKLAKAGAWEDAKDACHPGTAQKMFMQCSKVSGPQGVQGKPAHRCIQQISCNLCGDDLRRKNEALY